MAQHNELGKVGEQLAVELLQKDGYEILERNWFFQKAEVDIIAKKENILAVVEVKTRTGTDFGLPQDFVKPKKIRLLVMAIDHYVQTNNLEADGRFDIIAISKEGSQFTTEHLIDAFYHF